MLEVYEPRTEGMLGNVPCLIVSVCIEQDQHVEYNVVWWDGADRKSEWVSAAEVQATAKRTLDFLRTINVADLQPLKLEITTQGRALVNEGWIDSRAETVIAATLDLHSKYCEVSATMGGDGSPGIAIGTNDNSLHLGDSDRVTVVKFPELDGWTIHAAEIARYTLSICFVRCKQE